MFTPLFTPRGEHYLLLRRMEGQTENFAPRDDKILPWGTTSLLGSKFAPRGEVKNGPMYFPAEARFFRPQGELWLLGVNLALKGRLCPLWVKLAP
jgi:hypothetical protein